MQDGFIKVAAVTPKIKVADTVYNAGVIIDAIKEAEDSKAKIIVFPELCITGYSCSDLFLQDRLLNSAKQQLLYIAEQTADIDALIFIIGSPMQKRMISNIADGL